MWSEHASSPPWCPNRYPENCMLVCKLTERLFLFIKADCRCWPSYTSVGFQPASRRLLSRGSIIHGRFSLALFARCCTFRAFKWLVQGYSGLGETHDQKEVSSFTQMPCHKLCGLFVGSCEPQDVRGATTLQKAVRHLL